MCRFVTTIYEFRFCSWVWNECPERCRLKWIQISRAENEIKVGCLHFRRVIFLI
jgi:hypothetical protein